MRLPFVLLLLACTRILPAAELPELADSPRLASKPYHATVMAAARAQRLPPALIHAVIGAESGYDPRAVSPRGAQGLMQIMPATARELGLADPFEPHANIHAGSRYLRRMLERYRNLSLALAAYNAGPEAVAAARGIPPYPETRRFVVRAVELYFGYRGIPTGR